MKHLETTKKIGDFGETKAVHYLRWHGYTVKERNWRAGKCEIDIIASTIRDVVFVEVKTRTYRSQDELEASPPPHTAVHSEKQRLTRQAAHAYLSKHPTKKQPRMDVIEIWLLQEEKSKRPKVARIRHLKAAY